ncbi:MAG: respiratory nitrate reductase subunit gamma [Planctomycetota bacterium]|jgi:nitrate reductase gamma subunit
MGFIIGFILPLVTIIVFFAGVIYRVYIWKKRPSPAMTLFPAPNSHGQRLAEILKETFLFKRLFYGDLSLWVLGILFHVVLLITIIDHYDRIMAFMGMTGGSVFRIPLLSGGPTGIILLIVVIALILRRIALKRASQVSSPSDYLVMILILAIILTGDGLRFMSSYDVVQTREYFSGILRFSYKGLPDNNWFILHYFLAQILIICIPFSKILHFGGVFFTQTSIHKR